jgi:hypothetical protein
VPSSWHPDIQREAQIKNAMAEGRPGGAPFHRSFRECDGLFLVKSSSGNGARDDFNQSASGCEEREVLREETGH